MCVCVVVVVTIVVVAVAVDSRVRESPLFISGPRQDMMLASDIYRDKYTGIPGKKNSRKTQLVLRYYVYI